MFNPDFYLFLRFFIRSSRKWSLPVVFALLGSLSLVGQNRFIHVPSYAAGGKLPTLLAQHDVNNDGKLDLIVMNVNAATKLETISLLPGTGTGAYQAPKTMSYYPASYGVPLAADVNRDGHMDLVFSSGKSQITRVYLGQGESFQSTAIVSKGPALCDAYSTCNYVEMQVADLNKDGNPDLILHPQPVPGQSILTGVYVSLGNGNGSFRSGVGVFSDMASLAFTTGDFNNDSLPDLAVSDGLSIEILPGNGNGTFRQGPSQGPYYGDSIGQLLAADLRSNGKTDLILITSLTPAQAASEDGDKCRSGGVAVVLGNGDGTLETSATPYATGYSTYGATVTDMNGDRRPDLVVTNQSGASYSVLLNAGSGKFSTAVNYRSPTTRAGNFVIGDLNGDGRPDVTISSVSGVEVLKNTGGGKLFAPQSVDMPEGVFPTRTLSGDLNRDGLPDLALLAGWSANSCHLLDKIGELNFMVMSQKGVPLSTLQNLSLYSLRHSDLGLGDVNHDGSLDILALGNDFYGPDMYLDMLGVGGVPSFPLDNQYYSEAVGDFNRDGYADVAMSGGYGLEILLGDGKGNFSAIYTNPAITSGLTARDISGDGKVDLIEVGAGGVHILLGNGNGTFQSPKTYSSGAGGAPTIADFNKDGKLDLAFGGGDTVSLLLNNGSGTFRSAVNYPAGGPVSAIAAISLQGNGNQSILVADIKDNRLYLLAGDGKGNLAAPVNYYPGGGDPSELIVTDFNNDGALDVVVTDQTTSSFMVLYNTGGTSIKLTSSNVKPLAGQSVTFTVTLAASIPGIGTPSGTVTFKNGSTTLGTITLVGGKAVFNTATLTRGAHTITATYSGSSTFNSHVSTGLTVTVQ